MAAGAVDANGETSDDGTGSSAGLGLRAIVEMARTTARSDPALWLLGALSFCVRGGVLVVLLPILWVPTPVLLSIFLAPYLTSSGPSAEAIPAVAVSGGVAIVLVAVAIVTAAFVDLASFERVARNPAVAGVGGRPGLRGVAGGNRSATTLGLICLSLIGLVPVVAALVPLAFRTNAAAMSELQLPTRLDTPFAVTVIGRVAPGVILLVAIVLVADLFVTLASRELLAARFGLRGTTVHVGPLAALTLGAGRLARRPARTVAIWSLTWLITIAGIAAAVAALTLSWNVVREVLFSRVDDSPSGALWAIASRFLAVAFMGAIWIGSVTLCGIASSLRGALWTIQSLDPAVAHAVDGRADGTAAKLRPRPQGSAGHSSAPPTQ